ncbi:MAG: hypothetical protein ISR69_05830 [Gammaproteobacteria bacterium]|nr:hypothetical protein [Gammaproteobacteria bacterium]
MKQLFISIILALSVSSNAYAELNDQGLNSIISIIDLAITSLSKEDSKEDSDKNNANLANDEKIAQDLSSSTIVNMARTLGKLSFSRLQCGEATVLGEFTQRVQSAPTAYQNLMRAAFQEGFDKSKGDTKLLSDDECKRLTESRQLKSKKADDKVEAPKVEKKVKAEVEKPKEDPALKHMRLAHMVGQLAYKKKYCGDAKVATTDFNQVIGSMPKEVQKRAKEAYWKGYRQGKRMNKNLTLEQCHS